MPVTEILLLRHGHRLAWTLDPSTGVYSSAHAFPTGLPADPPLAAHGARQAAETGAHLAALLGARAREGRLRVYSSLFYRCLETLRPTVENLRAGGGGGAPELTVRGERGVGEWFGKAWFTQPVPAEPGRLRAEFGFPWLDDAYESLVIPHGRGETIAELHDRLARALDAVVRAVDAEFAAAGRGDEEVTLLVCGHAAQIIGSGRVLTGRMPEDPDVEDFRCYTCGISQFVRRRGSGENAEDQKEAEGDKDDPAKWRTNGGVAGGWDCVLNSSCAHLSQGEERGWHFSGDESFDSYGPGATEPEPAGGKVEDTNEGAPKL